MGSLAHNPHAFSVAPPPGKNLYTNEYVAIKLVSVPYPALPCPAGPSTAGSEEGLGNSPLSYRSPSSPGPRSCIWSTASTSSLAQQVRPAWGDMGTL